MNDFQGELRDRLRQLYDTAPQQAGTAIEERVLAAFRAQARRRRKVLFQIRFAAACFIAALGLSGWYVKSRQPGTATAESFRSAPAGFTALPYAQSDVPLEQAVIVRVTMRPAQLGLMGVPIVATNQTDKVSADLLIGQDGVARAVRLVE